MTESVGKLNLKVSLFQKDLPKNPFFDKLLALLSHKSKEKYYFHCKFHAKVMNFFEQINVKIYNIA